MPIYEFDCLDCRKPFQTYMPTMKWDAARCPKCGSKHLEKRLSRFAVVRGEGGAGDFEPGVESHDESSDSDAGGECSGDPSDCPKCDFDN